MASLAPSETSSKAIELAFRNPQRTAKTEESKAKDLSIAQREKETDRAKILLGRQVYILFAAVFVSTFLIALNGSIIATAIPKITTHFNSLKDIGWYGSAYLVATCALQPLVGRIYTHFPTKHTYVTFASIFSVGALVCATAGSSKALIIGRAVQGCGGAGVVNGAFAIIAAAASKEDRPLLIGIAVSLTSIGTIVGPLVGGALTQDVSWRWCFYINLPPSGLVICAFLLLPIPEQVKKQPVRSNLKAIVTKELDLVGFAIFAPACVMFLLAMIWGGNQYRWNSSVIIGLFCGAFGAFVVFAAWEVFKGEKAMIPPALARNRLVVFGCFTSFLQVGALLSLSYYLPIWFQVVKDESPVMSGVMVLPTAIAQAIGSIIAGKLVQVIGYCTPWALFGCVLTSIGSGLMTTFTPSTGAGPWIGYQILTGTGRGSVVQMPITAIQNFLPAKEVSIATSQVFFWQYLGGSVFLAISETIFTNTLRSSLKTYTPGVNPESIINSGASAVRSSVPPDELGGLLRAYNHAIVSTFYLAVGASSAAFLTSIGMGFQRLSKKESKEKPKGNDV
ncbi:uncharacterized protein Z519_12549 [Cladophialophora bantiana CBS 173.52]|uniref:Major facilitator superfamily (MFS) profile domain-containing protein n=1 Tax=Cladophialophora bantiana (strain ATCC 10958 / CBS 173.52 / CDC B-1940 / NIH 8579) TaxID=1442370 RepID=A0A0D2H0F7_CLAB1|nr:uncharacterized protein Z519_12549 [Cladophialophora bantiana CBS 173.52]KIW86763.1 hypothetical protein Z519_12549 [Cladophialophora bantiana CBS 173.52]